MQKFLVFCGVKLYSLKITFFGSEYIFSDKRNFRENAARVTKSLFSNQAKKSTILPYRIQYHIISIYFRESDGNDQLKPKSQKLRKNTETKPPTKMDPDSVIHSFSEETRHRHRKWPPFRRKTLLVLILATLCSASASEVSDSPFFRRSSHRFSSSRHSRTRGEMPDPIER